MLPSRKRANEKDWILSLTASSLSIARIQCVPASLLSNLRAPMGAESCVRTILLNLTRFADIWLQADRCQSRTIQTDFAFTLFIRSL